MNETESAAGVRVRAVLPLYAGAVVFFSLALDAGARFFAPWWGFLPCGICFLLALALYFSRVGTRYYTLTCFLNAAAAGFAASSYFATLALPLPSLLVLCGAGMLFLFVLLFWALSARPSLLSAAPIALVTVLFYLAALTALIVFWCRRELVDVRFALGAFDLFFSSFFAIACFAAAGEEEKSPHHLAAFFSFSAALLVAGAAMIAILLAAGGDGCDCDCDGSDCCDLPGRKKKGKTK